MRLLLAALSLLVLGLSGCGSPSAANSVNAANRKLENENSPFRWNAIPLTGGTNLQLELMPLPSGPTSANAQLKAEIEKALGQAEANAGRSAEAKVIDIKPFENSAKLVREVWLVGSEGRKFAYVVSLRPTADGGRDFAIEDPREI